jgi:hypothetical protein
MEVWEADKKLRHYFNSKFVKFVVFLPVKNQGQDPDY